MLNKRWFQFLVFFILVFSLILLISAADFIFVPVLKYVGAVAFPLIGAGILFYLTKPVMHFFERFKIHRIISIVLVFLLLILLGFLFVMYIWPIAQKQFTNLIDSIPGMITSGENFIDYWQANYTSIPEQVITAINDFTANIPSHIENISKNIFGFIGGFIGQVISIVAGIVLIPFFLFFMLKDGDKFLPFVTRIFTPKKAKNIRSLFSKIDETLTAFIQGQLIVSFAVGVLLFIGYLIIGLEYSLTLSLFAMLMNVIPFVGPFIAVIPALLVGVFQDPMMVVWVSIVMIAAQQIESNLISPNVMGRALDLHPLTVITVILAAGSIGGFMGILFAVPFYSVLKTIIIHFYKTYEESKKKKEDALI
ncbi:AI-2E family transporter [Virgibacillus profundi]|uniref:AI-2E family transporter n=1 Tax=Virgibacillus profundi TaxID=2024555 RepID=A0A2A2IJZ2_9BACI|nr:AI-2E family transporter [Virgibacillus profundi]PAV31435.1 AI-2E family transporter [Virgibacillus profundi]PXY55621.1 AI-2E family transporter [Virgibacillus profundi]